jgi:hypothetical protein
VAICLLKKEKMTKKLIVFIALLTFILETYGQSKWSLRTNVGVASGTDVIDGYYFSFDIGIPLFKAFEIAPTFSNASMLPNKTISYTWDKTYNSVTNNNSEEKPDTERESAENLSSISLLLNFKPFELMKSEKLKKHELILGAGISYNSYTIIKEAFQKNGNDYELSWVSVYSDKMVEPFYCKLSYNYLFRENLFFGIVAGINGFDGEAELLAGLQFGVKF